MKNYPYPPTVKSFCISLLFGISVILSMCTESCRKENVIKEINGTGLYAEQVRLKQNINKISEIVRKIYHNPSVCKEVNIAIASGFYADEVIKLKDLLHPEQSLLFRNDDLRSRLMKEKIPINVFAVHFYQILQQEYPELKHFIDSACAIRIQDTSMPYLSSQMRVAPIDPEYGGSGSGSTDITIYFPYAENFADEPDLPVSVLPARGELDGDYGTDPKGNTVWIDDDYAETHPTHIVGINGADPVGQIYHDIPDLVHSDTVHEVFIGYVICRKQYDHLISLTGNGGGSEIQFCRASAYLALDSSNHVTRGRFDEVSIYFKRKYIRKKTPIKVFALWDPDWNWKNREQVLAIYEKDTEPNVNLTFGLTTTLKIAGQELNISPFTFSYTVKTKDEIIRNLKLSHDAFFAINKYDQGCGFIDDGASTGLHGPWPIYDCGANVSYTLPEQIIVY